MPGRSTSGFHQPGAHCLHQAKPRSAVRRSASRMKGEPHSTKNRRGEGGGGQKAVLYVKRRGSYVAKTSGFKLLDQRCEFQVSVARVKQDSGGREGREGTRRPAGQTNEKTQGQTEKKAVNVTTEKMGMYRHREQGRIQQKLRL